MFAAISHTAGRFKVIFSEKTRGLSVFLKIYWNHIVEVLVVWENMNTHTHTHTHTHTPWQWIWKRAVCRLVSFVLAVTGVLFCSNVSCEYRRSHQCRRISAGTWDDPSVSVARLHVKRITSAVFQRYYSSSVPGRNLSERSGDDKEKAVFPFTGDAISSSSWVCL